MPRRWMLPAVGALVALVGYLTVTALDENVVYYLTPTEAVERRADLGPGERFRLGGLVVPRSVEETTDGVTFEVGDGATTVRVVHEGTPPQLFREDVGVLVEGAWDGAVFRSDVLIIRHDEEYRAPDGDGPYVPPTEG